LLAQRAAGSGHGLVRWSAADSNCSTVVQKSQFDVLSFTVGADDVAEFSALRLSDGRKVLAKVDASGTITTLDEGTASEVISLERIR
jgi:hypothetical protein